MKTEASPAEDVEAALAAAKRMRQTQKMQRYRKRLVEKADVLRGQVVQMEAAVKEFMRRRRSLASSTQLPWKEVAKALESECNGVEAENKSLQSACHTHRVTILAMKHWVAAHVSSIPTSPRTSFGQSWRHVTLSGHPTSRRLGLDWITRQMHHNTDVVFQRCLFPPISSRDIVDDFVIEGEVDDHGLLFLWRDQRDVPLPLETVRDLFARPHFYNMLGGLKHDSRALASPDEAHVVATDTKMLEAFHGMLRYGHYIRGQEHVHYLSREFDTPDRCVFVAQNITDDELLHNDAIQCNRMDWYVLDRLGPTRTKLRALGMASQMATREGPVSLEDEAHSWGIEVQHGVDLESKERSIRHRINQIASVGTNSYNQDLELVTKEAGGVDPV
ncbi:Aste57867_18908 [Aphanomyces stellatus]|uniref:Aste57867_18908 protein n=1 Tax=Aphanomyces stellatus TaxID=120398 RepID=A0A485LBA0_9STRA|nr:hypothetical protein As57867_018844 [Aphanomyces stellatus]VFT95640.1 Aste57867_18908 [Aphanomyces stellatus]